MKPFLPILPILLLGVVAADDAAPSGKAVIRAKCGTSEIVITTTDRLAGAIHSLTWNGKEFIDSTDHGRQLQSACALNCGNAKNFWAEAYNPTEAGSRNDGPRSTSKLLKLKASGRELETTTQMAFWLAPGQKSGDYPALNTKTLSNYLLRKKVKIGLGDWANAIDYQVTFTVPKGEKHTLAQFEALTGYMPAEFSRFWAFDPSTKKLVPLDDGPGEQQHPVVLATANGSHAMGIWSPDQPSKGFEKLGYGRFRFKEEKVVKWNCVFRVRDPAGIKTGDYSYRMVVVVGALEEVRKTLAALTDKKQ